MPYRIWIFNQRPIGRFGAEGLLADIRAANFDTLCRQYGLDPAMIDPTVEQLAVEQNVDGHEPYFLLWYQPRRQPPIIVNQWELAELWRNYQQEEVFEAALPPSLRDLAMDPTAVYSVSLEESQLFNLGLLLAYEIARWVAYRGSGLVFGLDGTWYRLNPHQAFIPVA